MTDAPFWEGDWENVEKVAADSLAKEATRTIGPIAVVGVLAVVLRVAALASIAVGVVAHTDWRWRLFLATAAVSAAGFHGYRQGASKERRKHTKGKPHYKPSLSPALIIKMLIWNTVIAAATGVALYLWWPLIPVIVAASAVLLTGMFPYLMRKRFERADNLRPFLGPMDER